MRNSIYIPFLFIVALAYISAIENYQTKGTRSPTSRQPASVPIIIKPEIKKEECKNIPPKKLKSNNNKKD